MKLNDKIIFHFLGLLLLFNGGFMLLSALISLIYQDGVTLNILFAGIITMSFGALVMLKTRDQYVINIII